MLIRYVSHGYHSGYGEAGRRLVNALVELGVDVQWVPIQFDPDDPVLPDSCTTLLADLEPLRTTVGVPDLIVIHAVPEMLPFIARHSPPGVPLVCHTVWEAPELQAHWPALLNQCAGVVVPTTWNAEAFVRAGVTVPVGVIPHAVSTDQRRPEDDAWLGWGGVEAGNSFVVHSVAAWIPRKAPWLTVEAYARAFGPEDDTLLVLRTDTHLGDGVPLPPGPEHRNRLTSWSVAAILHRHGPTGRVHLDHQFRSQSELHALHRRSNAWLSLPHSEGWNLGAFDAAAVGTPVITTGYGGPTDYLDPDVSYLVPGQTTHPPGSPGETWVDPDMDAAVEALRSLRNDPQGRFEAELRQRDGLQLRYAPARVGREFMEFLSQIGVG